MAISHYPINRNYLDDKFEHVLCKCLFQCDTEVCVAKMACWKAANSETGEVLNYFVNYDFLPGTDGSPFSWAMTSFEVDAAEYERLAKIQHDFRQHPDRYLTKR